MLRETYHSLLILIVLCCLPMFFGCARGRAALKLVEYVNQEILDISQLELYALNQYASVTGEKYTTDQHVYETLKYDVLPYYHQFLVLLRRIRPPTDEVKQLHGVYIQGAEWLYSGFRKKMLGIQAEDTYLIRSANLLIEKGRTETERWRIILVDLYRKYGMDAGPDA